MKNLYLIVMLCILGCCSLKHDNAPETKTVSQAIDNLSISDTTYTSIKSLLTLDEYVILENSVPLANVNRVIITEEQIFVFDSEPKIVCYNYKGKVEFKIANRGKGVGEFVKIVDFAIDKESKSVKVYDSSLRKVLYFDVATGKFKYDRKIDFAPHGMANFNGYDYYYNPYNFNYPKSKKYHYSLIKSKGEKKIAEKYFPHDPVISSYLFGEGNEFPFFYGEGELLYLNRFETLVYSITKEGVYPLLKIQLPNEAPKSYIQKKPDPIELIKSKYSSGLTDIYRVDNILYFAFTNGGYITSTFYDLSKNRIIYCGKRINPVPSQELPVYYPIRGVSNNRFFSLVPPSAIIEKKENNEQLFPQKMLEIDEMDNPVLVLYSVNNYNDLRTM